MTEDEAARLEVGERVTYSTRKRVREVAEGTVAAVSHTRLGLLYVRVRPAGRDSLGRRLGTVRRWAPEVLHAAGPDALSANVYADWLAEQGQHQAAAMLRQAFPMDDGRGGAT